MRVYRTVLNAGIYDLLHEGHLNLLRKMNEIGEQVIVVLHNDLSCFEIKDKFPIQSLERRKWQLENCGLVDSVIVTEKKDPLQEFRQILMKEKDVIYVRGDDLEDFPGKLAIDEKNIPIKYLPYTEGVSSSQIKKQLWS